MSKFLKFIVHFIVICTIVCVVGLAVPPFLGITTEIMDDSGKETNLPMGSVTYAIPVKIKEAAVGDSILYQTDSKAYRYMITEMDKKNLRIRDQIQKEYFRIRDLLQRRPTRMDLITYMDDEIYQMAISQDMQDISFLQQKA